MPKNQKKQPRKNPSRRPEPSRAAAPRTASKAQTSKPRSAQMEAAIKLVDETWVQNWPRIVARAWSDETFRQNLLQNPAPILAEYGIPVEENLQMKVIEGQGIATLLLMLPPKPRDIDLAVMHPEKQSKQGPYPPPPPCHQTPCCL